VIRKTGPKGEGCDASTVVLTLHSAIRAEQDDCNMLDTRRLPRRDRHHAVADHYRADRIDRESVCHWRAQARGTAEVPLEAVTLSSLCGESAILATGASIGLAQPMKVPFVFDARINVLAFAFLKGSASCSDTYLRALRTSITRSAASRMNGRPM
jgi:hypothetical protein